MVRHVFYFSPKFFGILLCLTLNTYHFSLLIGQTPVINFSQLQDRAENKHNDTLYVVNFWATWCDPCVKEIPYFKQASVKFSHKKVRFFFASLDPLKELNRVDKFAAENKLKPNVALLHAGNPNDWINKIDSSWSGAIPATVMYRMGKKLYFREGEFTLSQLEKLIQSKLDKK